MKVHNFNNSLKIEDYFTEITNKFYYSIFDPLIERIAVFSDFSNPNHRKMQRNGIDKKIVFNQKFLKLGRLSFIPQRFLKLNGLLVEEKVRAKDYGDILIETYSKYPKTPGWIEKSKADIFAYFIEKDKKTLSHAYLIDMQNLRKFYSQKLKPRLSDVLYSKVMNIQGSGKIKFDNELYLTKAQNRVNSSEWDTISLCVPFTMLKGNVSYHRFNLQ